MEIRVAVVRCLRIIRVCPGSRGVRIDCMNDWNIQSRSRTCEGCAQPFVDQAPCHTLLFEEAAELRRQDLCQRCWELKHEKDARERQGFLSHWQGVFEAPPEPTEPIQKESAETLLRKLVEREDPRYIPAGYILAVMLERKRLLRVKEQLQRDSGRVFVYEHAKTGDVFTIVDPGLQLTQLEAVQRDVAALLEHGLPPRDSAAAESAATETLDTGEPACEQPAG